MSDKPYKNKISFIPQHENWGIEGGFMAHVHNSALPTFLTGFISSDLNAYFEMTIRPYLPGCGGRGPTCMTFRFNSGIIEDARRWIPKFLRYVASFNINGTLVYKEGEYGYEIDSKGEILRTWTTDDGMC